MIIGFDLITVVCYVICGFIPLSAYSIVFIFIGSLFAQMEHPIYDALVADLSTNENRDKAYSLNYLGCNLGFVLAPSIGGLLFDNYLHIAFIISGLATFSSTILIFFMIKDVNRCEELSNINIEENMSVVSLLKKNKIIVYFILCNTLTHVIYNQSHFLLPLNLEYLHGGDLGALLYGTLSSMNALIVCLGTPMLTLWTHKYKDLSKMIIAVILFTCSFLFFISEHRFIPFYYIHMFIFTIGEILNTLGMQPYLTKRIPASYRGRISSISRVTSSLCIALSQNVVGYLIDHYNMIYIWLIAVVLGIFTIICFIILRYKDAKDYPMQYK